MASADVSYMVTVVSKILINQYADAELFCNYSVGNRETDNLSHTGKVLT
jgi:hypothetical protein